MDDRKSFYKQYYDISDFGEYKEIRDLFPENYDIAPKKKKERVRASRRNTIITADEDLLFPSRGHERGDISCHSDDYENYRFENVQRELKEIGADRMTNETLENYYRRSTTEEEEEEEEDSDADVNPMWPPVNSSPVVQTKTNPKRSKNDRKKRNAFLNSLKKMGKLNDLGEPVVSAIDLTNNSTYKSENDSCEEFASINNSSGSGSYHTVSGTETECSSEEIFKKNYHSNSKRLSGRVFGSSVLNQVKNLKQSRTVRRQAGCSYQPEIVNHDFNYRNEDFPPL